MDERPRDADGAPSPPLQRLPSRHGVPLAVGIGIAGFLGLALWAPWGHVPGRSGTTDVSTAPVSSAALPSDAGRLPSAPPSAPRPSVVRTARYQSIIDNEWTIVALLTPESGPSVEEPATPHVAVAAPTAEGPFVVMQQGLLPVAVPLEQPGHPVALCAVGSTPRDRRFVHLPGGRVVFLGVTFPGMDRSAIVDVRALGGPTVELHRATSVAVQLDGMQAGVRYIVPASGPGGTVLFTATPETRLPAGPYRFDLRIPGVDGSRSLYACVDG